MSSANFKCIPLLNLLRLQGVELEERVFDAKFQDFRWRHLLDKKPALDSDRDHFFEAHSPRITPLYFGSTPTCYDLA